MSFNRFFRPKNSNFTLPKKCVNEKWCRNFTLTTKYVTKQDFNSTLITRIFFKIKMPFSKDVFCVTWQKILKRTIVHNFMSHFKDRDRLLSWRPSETVAVKELFIQCTRRYVILLYYCCCCFWMNKNSKNHHHYKPRINKSSSSEEWWLWWGLLLLLSFYLAKQLVKRKVKNPAVEPLLETHQQKAEVHRLTDV